MLPALSVPFLARRSPPLLAAALTCLGCLAEPAPAESAERASSTAGSFSLLTYNVAGLPIHPGYWGERAPQISDQLNTWGLVLVQEDFIIRDLWTGHGSRFHADLASRLQHPHRSLAPVPSGLLGSDGLSRFSRLPFDPASEDRIAWTQAYGLIDQGTDRLAAKGFAAAVHEIGEGQFIHVYNLHMDAGDGEGNVRTRRAQLLQLLAHVRALPDPQTPVILAGDWNMKTRLAGDAFSLELLADAGFVDACEVAASDPEVCREPELIDRVLFRVPAESPVELTPVEWQRLELRGTDGTPLSDHPAILVHFAWSARPSVLAGSTSRSGLDLPMQPP